MGVNLNQLRSFHAVASHQGFSAAARQLGVSQPGLTGQIKALEEAYGVRLFERRARGIELSVTGRALFAIAEELSSVERAAERLLTGEDQSIGGMLRVAADNPQHLMPILVRFRKRFPGVRVEASFGNSREVTNALRDLRVDAVLVAHAEADPKLHFARLADDPLVLLVARVDPRAKRKRVNIAALHGAGMVRREPGSRTQAEFERACEAQGVEPDYVLEISGREALREAVAAGFGAGVIARGEVGRDTRVKAISLGGVDVRIAQFVGCVATRARAPLIAGFLEAAR